LDFAVFCKNGKINIECDGDGFHLSPDQVHYDKTRNDELTAHGWNVLRYDTRHLLQKSNWVEDNLLKTIRTCGGYVSDTDDAVYYTPKKKDKGQGTLF
jgi:very-short-patch-repair endonuclease